MANWAKMAIIAISCLWENGLKYGQVASLLQKNQECSKLVKTEIEKSLIEKSYGEKKKSDKKSGVLGQFSFIIHPSTKSCGSFHDCNEKS